MIVPNTLHCLKNLDDNVLVSSLTISGVCCSEVIDITALESKIDAVEYMNRVQQYK